MARNSVDRLGERARKELFKKRYGSQLNRVMYTSFVGVNAVTGALAIGLDKPILCAIGLVGGLACSSLVRTNRMNKIYEKKSKDEVWFAKYQDDTERLVATWHFNKKIRKSELNAFSVFQAKEVLEVRTEKVSARVDNIKRKSIEKANKLNKEDKVKTNLTESK